MGVWIEIYGSTVITNEDLVTPCVGVWIEIEVYARIKDTFGSHSLRGSVD